MANRASNTRPAPDKVLVDIADYVTRYRIRSSEAYRTARLCLLDTLGCGLEALSYPACTKLMGPIVPGTIVPDGAKVPGTPFQLDPVAAAFNIGCMIRWKNMTVRGAPAIGAAAAYGMALAAINGQDLQTSATLLKSQRPTAFDLFFAVDHMLERLSMGEPPAKAAEDYVSSIVERCKRIGEHGEALIHDGGKVMTHCNAGALATVDYGTALAPIRLAWRSGRRFFVYVSRAGAGPRA